MTRSALLTLALLATTAPALANREVRESETTVSIPVTTETLLCFQGTRPWRGGRYSSYGDPDFPGTTRPFTNIQLHLDPPISGTFAHSQLKASSASHICSKVQAVIANASNGKTRVQQTTRTEINTFLAYVKCQRNTVETVSLNFGDFKLTSSHSKTEDIPQENCAE